MVDAGIICRVGFLLCSPGSSEIKPITGPEKQNRTESRATDAKSGGINQLIFTYDH